MHGFLIHCSSIFTFSIKRQEFYLGLAPPDLLLLFFFSFLLYSEVMIVLKLEPLFRSKIATIKQRKQEEHIFPAFMLDAVASPLSKGGRVGERWDGMS